MADVKLRTKSQWQLESKRYRSSNESPWMIQSCYGARSSTSKLDSSLWMVLNLKWRIKLTLFIDCSSSQPCWFGSMANFRHVNKTSSARPLFVITAHTNLFIAAWVLCKDPSWAPRCHEFWHKLQGTHISDHVFVITLHCRCKLWLLSWQTVSVQRIAHYYATYTVFSRRNTIRAFRRRIFSSEERASQGSSLNSRFVRRATDYRSI